MATAKKPAKTTRSKSVKNQSRPKPVSFHRIPEPMPFFTFKFTRQSVYWLILSLVVFVLGLWVVNLHMEVQSIYETIEQNESMQLNMPEVAPKKST